MQILLILTLLFSGVFCYANIKNTSNQPTLNENSFIALILNKHQLFLSDEIDYYLKQQNVETKWQNYYGWSIDLGAKYGFEKLNAEKDNTSYTYANNQIETNKEISLMVSKEFMKGVKISAKLSRKIPMNKYDKYRNLEPYKNGVYNQTEYQSTLETQINIPLLKNNNGGASYLYLDNAKQDRLIEELRLLESKEDILTDKLKSFIGLAVNIDKVKISKNYLTSAQTLLKSIDKNTAQNDKSLIHNKIIKIKRLLSENQVNLQNSLLNLQDDIKNINIKSIHFNYRVRTIFIKNLTRYLQSYSRNLKIYRLEMIKKNNYIKYYTNQNLADLDFEIWTINTRNQGNYSYYSYYNKNDFGVGLKFSYPLGGNSSNEFNLLDATLDLKKQKINYIDDRKSLVKKVIELEEELLLYEKNISSFIQQINNTNTSIELDKYNKNKGDMRFVLDELSDFYDLKLDYLDEELKYHIHRVEYNNLLDKLINSNIKCNFCKNNFNPLNINNGAVEY